ncbi:fungal-specific transcription factor domain-containing protein [Aspergillus pseudocaelatus]|uniref:Fungal-specific transcription factor domain-containing protein n=1 Tax=Aspergillus pseudocaelatus TaxID=1825620 RepID=A0ABQ6W5H7_9EURO|nr:fungal-specific transcription factor domain-containing protein [Aspergillus pseudocaelatus]
MIGTIGRVTDTPEFFGKSSAGSFMRQMQAGIDSQLNQLSGNADSHIESGPDMTEPDPAICSDGSRFHYVLPARRTADSLVQHYWELTYPVYPFLDRASFEEDYQALWTGSPTRLPERIVVALVNIVFALGTQVSRAVPPEQRQKAAKTYYDETQNSLSGISWDKSSLELVSCLLLTGVFLQTINRPQRCWMVIGYAIRMAESLGLHMPEYGIGTQSRRWTQLARRVWHGCVLMDRVLSMTLGRPGMISISLATAVPLPLEIDEDFVDTQSEGFSVRPDGHQCRISFYIHQLHFYGIINDILQTFYVTGSEQHQEADNIVKALRLESSLMAWNRKLPPFLRESSPVHEKNICLQRLAIINKVRFLHGRILLFRPIVAQLCLERDKDNGLSATWVESLARHTVIKGSNLCLKDSHQVIDLIYRYLDRDTVTGPLPSWWYCVLYVYTAATVLLAERLQPVIAVGITEYSTDVSWRHAIEILSAYARVGDSAKRCVAVLEALSARIDQAPGFNSEQPIIGSSPVPFSFEFFREDFGFSSEGFNLDDMLWLNGLPGNL